MANRKLGIDIEVKYPTANQIKDGINKSWQSAKAGSPIKVNIEPDKNSMSKMKTTIQKYLDSYNFDFKLRLDTIQAMKDMKELRREVTDLKRLAQDGIEVKFTGIKEHSKDLKDINGSIQQVTKKQDKADTSRTARLKEIMGLQKEMNTLQTNKVQAGAQEQAVYNKRIEELAVQLKLAKSEYKDMFGSSADDTWMIENVKRVGEFNVELKEAKQTQKETNQMVSEYTKLLNEEFKIQKDLQVAGESQSAVLKEQLVHIQSRRNELMESKNLEERMTDTQKEALATISQQNEYQLKLTQAKKEDVELAKRQNDTYKEMKADLTEIHKMHMNINELEAKQDAGVQTGREEDTLNSLRQQLMVREDVYVTAKEIAQAEGLITKEAQNSLDVLQDQHIKKEQIAGETAKLNADLRVTNNLYDDLMNSVKRVESLTRDMARAGAKEADVIRDTIRAEEAKQDEIRETLKAQERVNNAREDEYATMKRVNAEQEELNAERSMAKGADQYGQNAIIGMFDPRNVYNEGKQIAMTIYDVVATLDSAIVDIEKVSDASEAEMDAFKSNVFDFATEVGKSAEEYATSVERWVTAGFSLADGMELARESTMGAFVGNIDESDMVDYMSVPLISWKNTALESADILNVMNEVANNNAIEMDDLGQAYKRASGTASVAGTSFAELTGMVSGAQEATRLGGEKIGTAFRSIDINFSKMASKLSKSDVTKFAFFRDDLGINIEDANGELRSTYDIIGDLAGIWDTLNSKQQSTATFYAAGKNHSAIMQGLVGNWDDVTKATGEANEQLGLVDKTSGSAYKEFEKQTESVEYAVAGLKNAWAEFIHEISGGRGGVKMVVDQLRGLVEIATKLAQNDTVLSLGKTLLKATLWITASIAIDKVFKAFSGGLASLIGNGKSAISLISGLFGKGGAVGTVAGAGAGVAKTAGVFGKFSGVIGGLKLAFGKLIPVLGLAYGAVAVLDILGIDVVGTFKSMADGTFYMNEAVKEYADTYERTSKAIKGNSIVNKEFDDVDALLTKYKELNKEKDNDFKKRNTDGKAGNDAPATYSAEEFYELQDAFNKQAEALGIDLKITFNDYEHIKSQLDALEKQKKALEADSAKDLISNIVEQEALPSNQLTYQNDFEKSQGEYRELIRNLLNDGHIEQAQQYEEMLKTYSRTDKLFTDMLFNTEEFKKSKEAREKAMAGAKENRDELVKIHDSLKGYQLGKDGSFDTSQRLLPAVSEMNREIGSLDGVLKAIEAGGELTAEQARIVVGLYGKDVPSAVKAWGDAEKQAVIDAVNGQKTLTSETMKSVEEKTKALMKYSGEFESDAEIDAVFERLKGNTTETIRMLAELGETGRLHLGVSEEALAMYGEEWVNVMVSMQEGVDKLPDEKKFEYNLVTEDGYFNWDVIELMQKIPEELSTEYEVFDKDGKPQLDNIINLLDEIPEEKLIEYELKGADGNLSVDNLIERLGELDEQQIIDIFLDDTEFQSKMNIIDSDMSIMDEKSSMPSVMLNKNPFATQMQLANADLDKIDDKDATPMLKGDKKLFDDSAISVMGSINKLNHTVGTTTMGADHSPYFTKASEVDANTKKKRDVKVSFWGNVTQGLKDAWNKYFGGSKSVSIKMDKSLGITEPNIGGALGQGVSQSVGVSASTTSSSKGNPRYAKDQPPATVDSDVWRYWAKELFKGLPLEDSMDKLNKSVQNASDDNKKLISLYKEQNKLTNQQIAYEKDMKSAQQAEMNSILSQLRKQGFKTSGNQITNLGITKNMKGDKAERSTELLNQYNSLYKTINSTNDNIRQLNQDIVSNNKSIKDAQEAIKKAQEEEAEKRKKEAIEKELKSIEKSVKRAEGLLTNIENDMGIFSTKLGLVSDLDYELKLSVTEEGLNKSSQNIKKLTDEFNRLSKITVEYEENADTIQSSLESLKSEILDNADSILTYREALKDLEMERMANDFDKFGQTIEGNLGRINNNIDNLKDGLVSGQSLSSLVSSSLTGLDFNRKTKIERDFEQRLELERELNEALDGFAKKNIDRVKNVANSTLTIEESKYTQLLKLANGFSNGKVESVSISSPTKSIGSTTADTAKNKSHQAWLNNLTAINNNYVKAYNSMVSKYDNAMSKAKTASEKELLTNGMIIEQLKLQEDIYSSIMKSNTTAIKNTQDMLKDSSLTTEQRQQLLDNIEDYRQSSIDAQNSIKDSIQSRFDLEFEMIDEATDRASKYTTELTNMMNIAQALGSGNEVVNELYRALYQSKINEYSKATGIIEDLANQQRKFEAGSFEWNTLQTKILETQDSLSDLTIEILNANKDILGSQLDIIQEANEKLTLGTSAEQYDKYRSAWVDGIEKELELERLRIGLAGLEDKTLQGKLELMDRQEKVSRAELEYVNKQLEAVRLQEKLENIRGERNIQTLAKDVDGNWQWQYVADQSEYNATKEELDNIRLEIEKYREEQRRNYVDEMNDIIGKVRDGEYSDVSELQKAIANVNEMFDDILGDLTDVSLYDTASIIKAYQDYLGNNNNIISGVNGEGEYGKRMTEISATFEQAFLNITTDLSKLIADELKNALNTTPLKNNGNTIVIENQKLEFPNVTDANGLKEAFKELPQIARQLSTTK